MTAPWSLVLACDRRYVLPTAVCLRSAAANASRPPHSVHVLGEELTPADQRLIAAQADGAPVEFTAAERPIASFTAHPETAHVTPAMFLKCVAPRLAGPSADALVYLDSDTLVLGDLAELAGTPLDGAVAGLVRDRYVDANAIDPGDHDYYNSGVLLVDRPRWNAAGVSEELLAVITERADELAYPDQDAINKVLRGRIKPLDRRWNHMVGETVKNEPSAAAPAGPAEAAVVHYCGPTKPWDAPLPHAGLQRLYARYLDPVAG